MTLQNRFSEKTPPKVGWPSQSTVRSPGLVSIRFFKAAFHRRQKEWVRKTKRCENTKRERNQSVAERGAACVWIWKNCWCELVKVERHPSIVAIEQKMWSQNSNKDEKKKKVTESTSVCRPADLLSRVIVHPTCFEQRRRKRCVDEMKRRHESFPNVILSAAFAFANVVAAGDSDTVQKQRMDESSGWWWWCCWSVQGWVWVDGWMGNNS